MERREEPECREVFEEERGVSRIHLCLYQPVPEHLATRPG